MLTLNRVKIGLLALFIIVNGFFVHQYISSMDMAESVAVSVTIRNLSISTHALPDVPATAPIYRAVSTWAGATDISRAILGDDCYMVELNMWQNENYNLWVSEGAWVIYPQETVTGTGERLPGTGAAGTTARSWLRRHNIWGSAMTQLGTARDEAAGDRVVTFADTLGGHRVLDSYVTVWVNDGGIRRIGGTNWLATEYERVERAVGLMSLTALLDRFADLHEEHEQIEVTRVEFGHHLGKRGGEVREVITAPAVRLITDIGTFYVDARNGEIINGDTEHS